MDETGINRWKSKYQQLQNLSAHVYLKDKHPDIIIDEALELNGTLIQEWTRIFQQFWERKRPSNPEAEVAAAKKEVELLITDEKNNIIHQLCNLEHSYLTNAIQAKIDLSCCVQKDKAIEVLDTLQATRRAELDDKSWERSQRWKEILLGSLLSLVFGGAIAIFSVWITNRANRANLEPYLDLSLGEQNRIGMIPISSDTLHLAITNIGPTDVEDVQITFDTFYGSFGLEKIIQDHLQSKPTFSLQSIKKGRRADITFGTDDRFMWTSAFKNDEVVYRKDPKYKGLILFARLHARYRREVDKRVFHTTRIFFATRTSVIPVDLPLNRDDFFAGYTR